LKANLFSFKFSLLIRRYLKSAPVSSWDRAFCGLAGWFFKEFHSGLAENISLALGQFLGK